MKSIPLNEETATIASRIIWFEPSAQALSDPVRFMAYAMTYAMHEEMRLIRRYVSDDDFREALDRAPPGIIDPRSWAYWNSKMGRYPPPPLPVRRFGNIKGPDKMDFMQIHGRESPEPAVKGLSPEEERHNARVTWQNMLQGATTDLEEIRRQAREDWRAKYRVEDKNRK